jgi:hypothetical protein
MGRYIVDFACLERKIVIELDGGQHAELERKEYDRERDNWLKKEGYRILRFWDNEVLTNINGILEVIREHCLEHPPLYPLPSREGEKERMTPLMRSQADSPRRTGGEVKSYHRIPERILFI